MAVARVATEERWRASLGIRDTGPRVRQLHVRGRRHLRDQPDLGVEGEVAGTVGISQDLTFGGATTSQKSGHAQLLGESRRVGVDLRRR